MYDVITVGSSTIDVFAKVASELIKIKTPQMTQDLLAYPSGTKILIENLQFHVGGGGTNTAVALKRLGHKVAYIGKVGNDDNAHLVLDLLKKEKIDFLGTKGKGSTGYSIILDTLEHDRTILAHKGANNTLQFSDIDLSKAKTKFFYFSSMVEESFQTLVKLSEHAKKNNILIAFNPSNYLASKGKEYLKSLLKNVHLLVLNREEASHLEPSDSIRCKLTTLPEMGPKIVVITDGKKGVYAFDGSYEYTIRPEKIKVADATGAGDAFASSFFSGLIRSKGIEFSLKLGMVNAQSEIMHEGVKNGLLTYKEAISAIKKLKAKVKKTNVRKKC